MSFAEQQTELPDYLPPHLGGVREAGPSGEVRIRVTPLAFARASQLLHRAGARFITVLLGDAPEPSIIGAFACAAILSSCARRPRPSSPRPTARWGNGGRPHDGQSRNWPTDTVRGCSD